MPMFLKCLARVGLLLALLPALYVAPLAHAQGCQFVLGFATLHGMIPQVTGRCLEDEHFNPANGDSLQATTNGLLVWRKADNHTAFTNGYQTWVNGPHGLETRLNAQRFPWEPNPDGLPVTPDTSGPSARGDLRAILFVDAQHGWAAGAGRILATADGGANWTEQYRGADVIQHIDMLNTNDGFALGEHALLRTHDGGAHWQPAAEPPQELQQIHFLSPSSGYGVGGGHLYRTTDAAVSWQSVATPIAAGGVCFVSQDTGWVVNTSFILSGGPPGPMPAQTALFATDDGGATWQQRQLPAAVGRFAGLAQRLQCVRPGVLWDLLIGQAGAGNQFYALERSPDGGRSWALITGNEIVGGAGKAPGSYAGALSVVDGATAYLSGTCGACYPSSPTTPPAVAVGGTTDGGRTWQVFPVPGLPPVTNTIAFVTSARGWLVTYGDTTHPPSILATSDGGRTWAVQFSLH